MSVPPSPGKVPSASRGMLKRFALAAVAIVLLSTATTASAVLLEFDREVKIFEEARGEALDVKGLDDIPDGRARTIMVLGSDRRFAEGKNAKSRSDTVMLVRLDPDKGATSVMSLPRDLQVKISGSIDKLNAAYAYGGESLTVETVKDLLAPHSPTGKFPISHVVNINFGGFQRAVNYFDCMYIDIDKQYFNDNNPPAGGGPNYAVIDVSAGYQKLCGQDSLDYVRYRHFDSDLVRGARQQEYLRQAKLQLGVDRLVEDREELLKIFGRYTDTDIDGSRQVFTLIKLVLKSSKKPLREVQFPGVSTGDFVTASDADLDKAVRRFMDADLGTGKASVPIETDDESKKSTTKTKRKKRKQQSLEEAGVVAAKVEGEDQAVSLATKVDMPVLYPKAKTPDAQYMTEQSRAYTIEDREYHKFPAYRIVVRTRLIGQYYGIQGTKWQTPPILEEEEDEVMKVGGREFRIYKDGGHIRMIALKTKQGVYWVSNTLSQSLSNPQMIQIARSLSKITGK